MADHTFPTPEEAKKHFNAQERSIYRTPGKPDPGVSIINNVKEATVLLTSELDGNPVTTFKSRSPATPYPDPVAHIQKQIRSIMGGKVTAEQFARNVETVRDYLLYEIAYGDQTSNQRAKNLVALAKLLHEEAKLVEERLHRERQLEAKRTDQLLKAGSLQEQMLKNKAKRDALALASPKAPGE